MMPSKPQNAAKSGVAPDLFTTDGKPMSFYLRPGPVKRRLQPLITSGGGMMCNVQQPGAILLIDADERVSIPETTAHWYVSTMFIQDCIDKNQQLNIEDYRLNPEDIPRHSTRLNKSKNVSAGLTGGRTAYTPKEDAAILRFVSKHKADTGGNRLWQEMERQRVTSHSWQSMKYRYRLRLAMKVSEAEEMKTTDGESKEEESGESDVPQPHSGNDAPLQTPSPAAEAPQTDLTQTMATESTDLENAEDETSNLSKPEDPGLNPKTDAGRIEPETDEAQTAISPQTEDPPNSATPEKQQEKQGTSPDQEQQPQRRVSRRQLEFKSSPLHEPYGKKLRSSPSSSEKLSSPQHIRKKQSSVQLVDSPPSKRARGKSVAAVAESQQVEGVEATIMSETQQDEESQTLPQKGEKKRVKRKLGILELATKEFEDDTENSDYEPPDHQNPETEVAVTQSTAIDPGTAVDQASTQSSPEPEPEPEPSLQDRDCVPEMLHPQSEASDPAAAKAFVEASKVHLFIFDTESQQEDSQPLVGDRTTALSQPQPLVDKDTALSLTQVQLEEDVQRIKALMDETNEDVVSVTKALLKVSGDFSAALDLLISPSTSSGPFWNRCDDNLLLSTDPDVRQQLQEKYGETEVAKRIVFLEIEG